jgi:hypothetical protein
MKQMAELNETLYPHELLYKTNTGWLISFFTIGIILSAILHKLTIFLITGDF